MLIYKNGYFVETDPLLNGATFEMPETSDSLIKISRVLIIPTGGLSGKENDKSLKITLEEYLKSGGTVVVFAQQYGSHFNSAIPVPQGETLKTFGWREDNSCYSESAYAEKMHPVLGGYWTWSGRGSINVDGYFDEIPSNSTVILRRDINRRPLLVYYPYGDKGGGVILTTMFTDWGSAHGQASAMERRVVRDIITFAKNPQKSIPMFSLISNPNPSIVRIT